VRNDATTISKGPVVSAGADAAEGSDMGPAGAEPGGADVGVETSGAGGVVDGAGAGDGWGAAGCGAAEAGLESADPVRVTPRIANQPAAAATITTAAATSQRLLRRGASLSGASPNATVNSTASDQEMDGT
jgi:hypothetical protein